MALIDDVKAVVRENETNTELTDLIAAAKADIKMCGVVEAKIIDTDTLIRRCINLYCKAHYAYEDPKIAEGFNLAYEKLRDHLCLSTEYNTEVVV